MLLRILSPLDLIMIAPIVAGRTGGASNPVVQTRYTSIVQMLKTYIQNKDPMQRPL